MRRYRGVGMDRGGGRAGVVLAAILALLGGGGRAPVFGQDAPGGPEASSLLTGTVLDRQSGSPLATVRISLLDLPSLQRVATAESDDQGRFALPATRAGTFNLRVERIGYGQIDDSVTLVAGEEQVLTVHLVPIAVDLDPLVVTVSRTTTYYLRDFERRRTTGSGTFITRDQIEERRSSQTSQLLHNLGGVRVQYGRNGEASLFVRGGCRPSIFIDGAAIHQGVSIDMAVLPDDIEAVEVYSNATIPAQYAVNGACAAILVWTRPAVRGDARKKVSVWKLILTGGVFLTVLILRH